VVSCCLSAAAVRFLGMLYPPQISAFLTVRPTRALARWTVTGFPRFTHLRNGRVRAPSVPRGPGARTAGALPPAAIAASQRQALHPASCIPSHGAIPNEASSRGLLSFTRPAFPSPVTPGWSGRPWAFPSGFAPRRYSALWRTPKWEQALSTSLERDCRSLDPPFNRFTHQCATSLSQQHHGLKAYRSE
jgi:hypothetical protein